MSMSALPHTSFWWYNSRSQLPPDILAIMSMSDLPHTSFWWYYITPSSLQISLLPSLCQPYLTHLSGDITSLPATSRYPCYHLYVRFTSHIFLVILLAPSSLQISLLPSLCHIYLTHLSGDITRSQLPTDILATISMSALPHTSFWWYNTLPAPSRYPCYHVYVRFTSHIFLVI